MQSTIQLRISPADAANASVLLAAIAQELGKPTSQVNGYHILKQSIDARSRQQVWINLTLQVFIEEPVSDRQIEPSLFPILPKNAKEVHIIGAGPAGLFAALECIQLGLRPIVLERGKDVRSRRRDLARLNKEGISSKKRKANMDAKNPKYILRNYMSQMAIEEAEKGNYSLIEELYQLIKRPYDEQSGQEKWFAKRPEWARNKVGCSMLSCSS